MEDRCWNTYYLSDMSICVCIVPTISVLTVTEVRIRLIIASSGLTFKRNFKRVRMTSISIQLFLF